MPIKLHCKGMCFAADERKENCPLPPAFKCNMEKNKGRMISSRNLMLAWNQVVQSENELMVARKFASTSRSSSQGIKRRKQTKWQKRDFANSYHNQGPSQQAREEDIRLTQKELAGPETKRNGKPLPRLHTKNNSCFQPRWT